jgi:hypothetical protein
MLYPAQVDNFGVYLDQALSGLDPTNSLARAKPACYSVSAEIQQNWENERIALNR